MAPLSTKLESPEKNFHACTASSGIPGDQAGAWMLDDVVDSETNIDVNGPEAEGSFGKCGVCVSSGRFGLSPASKEHGSHASRLCHPMERGRAEYATNNSASFAEGVCSCFSCIFYLDALTHVGRPANSLQPDGDLCATNDLKIVEAPTTPGLPTVLQAGFCNSNCPPVLLGGTQCPASAKRAEGNETQNILNALDEAAAKTIPEGEPSWFDEVADVEEALSAAWKFLGQMSTTNLAGALRLVANLARAKPGAMLQACQPCGAIPGSWAYFSHAREQLSA
eukprot:TRINITY_DN10217_c1_g3_i1.p1 TRINITY_DN10217_c1_g3~~TRINITY_DN10217_c1_g3_i1.p1  ORF type:complete len:300 (-),score=40.25 TRINITY_DN10217_c1_g3_i1:1440-2279(-)